MDHQDITKLERNGTTWHLIGTAHVSHESVDLVRKTIEEVSPDAVCVELCSHRFEAITDPKKWEKTDILSVIKEKKAYALLAQIILSGIQKKIADQLGIQPGAEMKEAIRGAKKVGAELALVDREIRTTLKRAWASAGIMGTIKLMFGGLLSFFDRTEITEQDIEKLKEKDALTTAIEQFSSHLPGIKKALIDERDLYLCAKIRETKGRNIVAVVGAGHIPGIIASFDEDIDVRSLEELPKASIIGKVICWGIPLVVCTLIVLGFIYGGIETSEKMAIWWIIINGVLCSLGIMIAGGHIVTVFSGFVAAPITSLNPTFAAGWVAGIIEAWLKKPKVSDFQSLIEDCMSIKGFWKNRVTKILLVVALANLGSSIGTLIGGSIIAKQLSEIM